jgi:hypothetical protein
MGEGDITAQFGGQQNGGKDESQPEKRSHLLSNPY